MDRKELDIFNLNKEIKDLENELEKGALIFKQRKFENDQQNRRDLKEKHNIKK